jgi:hypothetical protein
MDVSRSRLPAAEDEPQEENESSPLPGIGLETGQLKPYEGYHG